MEAATMLSPRHRETGMLGHGVADPAEITIMAKAVSDYCSRHQIMRMDDREQAAIKVMSLCEQGIIDLDQLSMELEKAGWRESGFSG